MEAETWGTIKWAGQWVLYILVGVLSWFFREQASDQKTMKQEISELKVKQAVTDAQIKDIREDIKDLTQVVRDAERSIVSDIKDLRKDLKRGAR